MDRYELIDFYGFTADELTPEGDEDQNRIVECWYCDEKVSYEDANFITETFSDGRKRDVHACPHCYNDEMNDRAEEMAMQEVA